MSFMVVIIHIILAVLLFYIVNWIGDKAKPFDYGYVQISLTLQEDTAPLFNYLFKVLAPIVYMIIVCAIFQAIGFADGCERIYLMVIYYWLFRLLYITAKGHLALTNWPLQIFYWVSSIGLALWAYTYLIEDSKSIFPDPKELIEELWILIIVFLYSIINKIKYSRKGAESRIKNYIIKRYLKYNKAYGTIVNNNLNVDILKVLTYSIMIYENYNRPNVFRFAERTILGKTKKPHTYGIMQVMSDIPLKDEESIVNGISLIKKYASELIPDNYEEIDLIYPYSFCCDVVTNYNPGDGEYAGNVMNVFSVIYDYLGWDMYESYDKKKLIQSLSK